MKYIKKFENNKYPEAEKMNDMLRNYLLELGYTADICTYNEDGVVFNIKGINEFRFSIIQKSLEKMGYELENINPEGDHGWNYYKIKYPDHLNRGIKVGLWDMMGGKK